MVLSGPPGAGKTTFALGLVRSMMRDCSKPPPTASAEAKMEEEGENALPKHIAYYISTEVKRERLRRMFDSRGWFADKKEDDSTEDDALFHSNPESGRTSGLHVINPPLEIERPVKSSEELVNFIVRQIAVQPPPGEDQYVFIIVDSITALFKDCAGGESRRQVHELVHRLRGQFAGNPSSGSPIGSLGMILLLSEEGLENKDSPGMETYVGDIVFNLNLKSLTMGTRLRTLEITKSQGTNMMMGTHTWQIVTGQSLDRLIAGTTLKNKILKAVGDIENRKFAQRNADGTVAKHVAVEEAKQPWGTIMVASRPYFHPIKDEEHKTPGEEEACGVCGLDEMLRFDPDYWFMDPLTVIRGRQDNRAHVRSLVKKETDDDVHTSIKAGNVTMLVGEPGTGKTSLCYHIIASHLAKNKNPRGGSKVKKDEDSIALLVGFEHDFRQSFDGFVKRFRFGSKEPGSEDKGCLDEEDCERCEIIYRPRSGLHFNLLLLELRTWLTENADRDKRVAIDGISHLASTHSRLEFSQMLDALVALFAEYPRDKDLQAPKRRKAPNDPKGKARKASLFLTYEALQNDSVLDPDTLRLPADNIIRFSHKVIEDMRRTAVTVIKSSHPEYDNMVRELVLNHEEPAHTYICSGFDAYSGMLQGRVRKAEVVLQLFQENDREQAYNLSLQKHLNELLPYQIVLRDFSRFDMTSALDGKGDHVKAPSGDVQISHTDEWWLAHKVQVLGPMAKKAREEKKNENKTEEEAWRDFRKYVSKNKMTKLAGFVSVTDGSPIFPGDFWCFEMEKAWNSNNIKGQEKRDIGPYGLPSFLDFGMLCVHRDAVPAAAERPACHTDYTDWEDYDKVPWPALASRHDGQANRRKYAGLLNKCMLPWCTPATIKVKKVVMEWFENPKEGETPSTLVDLMKSAISSANAEAAGAGLDGKKTGEIRYGFAWDSRTPETAACFLYELAWAFGGTQHLFAEEDQSMNLKAVRRALSFIGFLVHAELMPACPTLTDSAQAAFSRHYFSTYIDVVNRASKRHPQSNKMKLPHRVEEPILMSLGFMPPGPEVWHPESSIREDRAMRRQRLDKRRRKILLPVIGSDKADDKTSALSQQAWKEVRHLYQAQKCFPSSPNPNDIDELERWGEFRDILHGVPNWEEVLDQGGRLATKGKAQSMPAAPPGAEAGARKNALLNNKPHTGYGCCGAWMVGVKSPAGAPGLAQVLLQEITSLNFAKKRARMGAGLPARQDFYRYYGDRPVTGMEYLTWSEMLMYLGSTSRRRDRIYMEPDIKKTGTKSAASAVKTSPRVDPAEMHRLIHHALIEIMHVAGSAPRHEPEAIITSADKLAESLFKHVAESAKK